MSKLIMRKVILAILGVIFILIGAAGLVLPFLPGWVFIFAGFSLIVPRVAARLKRRLLRKFSKHELVYLQKWRKSGVHAGFTTRHFPLFLSQTDDLLDPQNRSEFRKLLAESKVASAHGMKPISKFAFLNQVHGNNVAALEDEKALGDGAFHPLNQNDGVITRLKDLALLVMTADCLPIFMKAPGWVGLVHAGWRGTKGEVAKKAYQLLRQKSGCRNAEVEVIFGPCIGFDQYEVGPEFREFFPKRSLREKREKLFFDLAGENKRQLLLAGACRRNITELDLCTVEDNEDYYSFRKEEDAAGRMVSFVVMQDSFSSGYHFITEST
ncbi:MAG: hypothetical protein A3C47_01795 [Omnitrophica bacterium RIFCSPHIGHO2_02_FULL_51_18]|nr:MAG: hypothetical protein A3C47_01795 [Omnitrophica bacterium RIFCSPHIGHO2_02_FULL_51_18]